MNSKIFDTVALLLLAMFFLPYVYKLPQVGLIVILLGGLAMPIYDFVFHQKTDKP